MTNRPTLYAGVVLLDDARARVDHDECAPRQPAGVGVSTCAAPRGRASRRTCTPAARRGGSLNTGCTGLLYATEPDRPDYSPITYYTATCGEGHEYLYVGGRVPDGPLPEPVPQRDITEPMRENP